MTMDHRALIMFAKLPRAGEVKTRLGRAVGMDRAADIYKELAEHAFGIADELASSGTKVYLFYDPIATGQDIRSWIKRRFSYVPQQGRSLGDRMQHAFAVTVGDGAQQTVIIGTDVPELQASMVNNAFNRLANHDIVVGPSLDGGYFLLGMTAPIKDVFNGVEWSTDQVFDGTMARIRQLDLSCSVLPALADIDTEQDLREYETRIRLKK
ncbi:MAG TPA: TIGR04282 family arsenosugar biosynthesis glycosyltransferase [Bacteroidota bacterium]|nr:TIGR04282 family arsenosugar biosynthesis glycosyltransferase [Bacteroidota bacterium]